MKCITAILFLFVITSCTENDKKINEEDRITENWDKAQFYDDLAFTGLDSLGKIIQISDSIIAYNWNANDKNPANVYSYIVDAYGKFDSRIEKKLVLNDIQKKSLIHLITDSMNYEGSNSMCFIPHIAFVYYKKSKIIGQSNVCFLCSGIKSVPKSTTALNKRGNKKLKNFCRNLGLKIVDK